MDFKRKQINKFMLSSNACFVYLYEMDFTTIMDWINILVHVYVGPVKTHPFIVLPCFMLLTKACPFRSGFFTTTTTSSSTSSSTPTRVQYFLPVRISQVPPSSHDCFS